MLPPAKQTSNLAPSLPPFLLSLSPSLSHPPPFTSSSVALVMLMKIHPDIAGRNTEYILLLLLLLLLLFIIIIILLLV